MSLLGKVRYHYDSIYVEYDDDEEHEATALDSFLAQSIMDSQNID